MRRRTFTDRLLRRSEVIEIVGLFQRQLVCISAQIRIAQRYKQAGVEKVRVRLSDDAGVAFQLTGVRCVWRPTSIIVPPIRILCNADRPDLVVTGRV